MPFGKRGTSPAPVVPARSVAPAAPPAFAEERPKPEFGKAAKQIGGVLAVAAVILFRIYLFTSHFTSGPSQIPGFIPEAELPKTAADGRARSADLVARFPGDPRAHYYRAASFLKEGDPVAAEQELRVALAGHAGLAALSPEFEPALHGLLALALLRQGRRDDAKIEAQPVCNADIPEYEDALRYLRTAGICG
jgi:hypothetical protein